MTGRKSESESEPKSDRISALPDPILIRILSLLPTKQFIATATLSKRWQYLWLSATSLIFEFNGHSPDRCYYFLDFVAATLMLNTVPKIDKFSVTMNHIWKCRTNTITTVSTWIRFATLKLAEEIHIDLSGDKYILPQQFYKNDRVKVLKLKGCHFEPVIRTSCVRWPSLEYLTIKDCGTITKQMINRILDGCPKIVCFDLINSYDPDRKREVNYHYHYIRVKST